MTKMTKKDIELFIAEYKQNKYLEDLYKQNIIELEDYFPESGVSCIEDVKIEEKEVINNVPIYGVSLEKEKLVVDNYYRCSNIPLVEIALNLGMAVHTVRAVLTKHFENLKIQKNGNDFKNENK